MLNPFKSKPPSYLDQLRSCRRAVYEAFQAAAAVRNTHRDDWEYREREAMVIAANRWAESHGVPGRISVHIVAGFESAAIGHVDYAMKISLYIAEWILGTSPFQTRLTR